MMTGGILQTAQPGEFAGYERTGRGADLRHLKRVAAVAEAMRLISTGRASMRDFLRSDGRIVIGEETMTTSDFPLLFGDVIDRSLLGLYQTFPSDWRKYARVSTIRDFRPANRFSVDGASSPMTAITSETDAIPQVALNETRVQIQLQEYARIVSMSWRAFRNDDLGAFSRIPEMFAQAAVATEEYRIASLLVNASGPLSTVFSSANKNQVTTANGASSNNPQLGYQGLQDAITVLASQKDASGNPVWLTASTLIIPPQLLAKAQDLVRYATSISIVPASTSSGVQVHAAVPDIIRTLQIAVNPFLSVINTTSGTTCWFLAAANVSLRPAIEAAFLPGEERPSIWLRESNARRLGGGSDPMDGSFDDGHIAYKVRHVFGAAVVDPRMIVVSTGTGS